MLHTIKPLPKEFNLLFLMDGEFIMNSIKCYCINPITLMMEEGKLHLNSRSIIVQPNNLESPLLKLKYSENIVLKIFNPDELFNFYNVYLDSKENDKQSSIHKNFYKKNSNNDLSTGNHFTSGSNKNTSNKKLGNYVIKNNNPHFESNHISVSEQLLGPSALTPTKISCQSHIVASNLEKSMQNQPQNHLNLNLNNMVEMINKSMKCEMVNNSHKINTSINNIHDNKNLYITNSNNLMINFFKELNTNKFLRKNIPVINNSDDIINVIDLITFFQEKFLNFLSFCEVFQYIQTVTTNTKYQIMLIKINRSHHITRTPNTIYDVNLTTKSYFIILQACESKMKIFNLDRKFVLANHHKNEVYDRDSIQYVNKKIIEDLKNLKSTYKCKATRILPEGIQHGLLILNETSVEFKPITNNYKNENKSIQIKLSRIKTIIKYRYLYKIRGLNISLYSSRRSKIFFFDNDNDYNFIKDYLLNTCSNIDKNYNDVNYHTQLWVNGLMPNYDYILYLNNIASRSFSDLSQYPVFPWVLTNFNDEDELDISEEKNYRDLSKPIGALNPDKFERFNKRYMDMCLNNSSSDPPYFYGTHYSNPAYVIYFLTRYLPDFQLQMQSGSYGPSERLFNSIKDCWGHIFSSLLGTEVMELIPEFYSSNGEFLINTHDIQISKGKTFINNVRLPRWAKSASDFINICRSALESEYVSSNINNWIDLIFGCKQRGKDAEANDNMFYHMTYDNFNYDDFPDDRRSAAFTQILQFGQTPQQLFTESHPKKRSFDILQNQITINPKEMLENIEKYKKENERLENNYKIMVDSKFMEKQRLINEYKEMERKRMEKLRLLTELLNEKESKFKSVIDKIIDQNEHLKENFNNYDDNKDKFYKDIIENMEISHNDNILNKYSNSDNLYKYIKSLETSINHFKIKETDYLTNIENLSTKLSKQEKNNEKLKNQIDIYKKNLNNKKINK